MIYKPTDTEEALETIAIEGQFDETGGSLGERDWTDILPKDWLEDKIAFAEEEQRNP